MRIAVGRPDVFAAVSDAFEASGDNDVLHVWTSGPQHLIAAVRVASSAPGRCADVRVFPTLCED